MKSDQGMGLLLSLCLLPSSSAFIPRIGSPRLNALPYKRWQTISTRARATHLFQETASHNENDEKPTVAIVGAGAVGGYYGARLWETGLYNVKFHMRGEHLRKSQSDGLQVSSIDGDITIPSDQLQAYEETSAMGGPVDWVIVALKSSALAAIPPLILPLLDPKRTRVLAIMNGLIEEDLIELLQKETNQDTGSDDTVLNCCTALYGGMALVCSNRLGPGRIDHTYAGLLSGGVAARSSSNTDSESDRRAFEDLWKSANVPIAYEASILSGRWRKNVWNLPFNGISVAMGGVTVDKIVTDNGLRKLADQIMDETIAVANADLRKKGFDESMYLGDKDKKQMFDLSDGMGPYRTSTMIDFIERNPMEVEYLFRKPVERAIRLGIPVPRLETLVLQIEAHQRQYNLF